MWESDNINRWDYFSPLYSSVGLCPRACVGQRASIHLPLLPLQGQMLCGKLSFTYFFSIIGITDKQRVLY